MWEIGQWEHFVVSHIKALVPEKVKQTWREWRQEARRKELEMTGDDDFSDTLEMASWGVEEADAANKRDASKSPSTYCFPTSTVRHYHILGMGNKRRRADADICD